MKKHFRLFSIFLVIILSFSFLSVNSFAADDENLIDSNMSNWVDYGEESPGYFQPATVQNLSGLNYITVNGSSKSVLLIDVTEFLKVGEHYRFTFMLPTIDGVNSVALNTAELSFGLLDYSTGAPGSDVFAITVNNSNKSDFLGKVISYDFTYTEGFTSTCIALCVNASGTSYNYLQLYIDNLSLVRVPDVSEEKLDGILGWLQELWNSIVDGFSDLGSSISSLGTTITNKLTNVASSITSKLTTVSTNITNGLSSLGTNIQNKLGEVITNLSSSLTSLGDRIQTKLGEVITNLSGVLNSVKESITTKLGEVITGLTGELRMLGDNIINYLLFFDDEVPENPFEGVDSPLEHIQGFFDDLIDYLSSIGDDIETVIDSITGPVTLLDHFTKRFEWLFGIVIFTLMLIVVSRFIGL